MEVVREDFATALCSRWRRYVVGTGELEVTESRLRLSTSGARSDRYSDAQIDDYQGLPRRRFRWAPPLRLTVRARFSHPEGHLQGTAGFGFWNDPFLMTGKRLPALPRAAWFFYASAPSNIKLDSQAPGYGWKAATIDALRPAALPWMLAAPLAVPLMNFQRAYRVLWPAIQRSLKVREAVVVADMTLWHTYVLEWGLARARFGLSPGGSGAPTFVLDAPSPRGPLGFVMWLDNQYLVATPQGRLRWGLLDIPGHQSMEIDWFVIEPLPAAPHG